MFYLGRNSPRKATYVRSAKRSSGCSTCIIYSIPKGASSPVTHATASLLTARGPETPTGITTACSASTHRRSGFARVYERRTGWLSLRASFPYIYSSHIKAHKISRFDPRIWIKKNLAPAANASGEGTTKDDGLAIAGARGTGKAMTSKLSVEIVNEEDNEARRQEKQSEANAKRYARLSVNSLKPMLTSVWI